jgi:hypothetical protein
METIQYINTWSVALWSVTLFGAQHGKRSQARSIIKKICHHLDPRVLERFSDQVDRSKSTTKLEMISNSCTFIEQVGKCEAEIMVLGIYPVMLAWANDNQSIPPYHALF